MTIKLRAERVPEHPKPTSEDIDYNIEKKGEEFNILRGKTGGRV